MDLNEERLADIRKDVEDYPPAQYGKMLVDCSGECDLEWVHVLLEKGASLTARGRDNATALITACTNPDSECVPLVEYLLGLGCDVNVENADGESPLHMAVSRGATQTCRLLIDAGANVDHQDGKQRTPLLQAVVSAQYTPATAELAPMLLVAGANPNLADKDDETPLRLAAKLGLLETVTQLLDAGAEVEGAGVRTPLMEACASSWKDIVEILLAHDADAGGPAQAQRSPLMLAVTGKDEREDAMEPIVQQLLSAGANVNAIHGRGRTALYAAVAARRLELVQLLLDSGANPTTKDEDGMSLLEFAKTKSRPKIAELIEAATAARG